MEPHDPAVTKGTNYVRVSVADTSTGIDEAIKRESREMLGITDPMAEFLGVTIGPARP